MAGWYLNISGFRICPTDNWISPSRLVSYLHSKNSEGLRDIISLIPHFPNTFANRHSPSVTPLSEVQRHATGWESMGWLSREWLIFFMQIHEVINKEFSVLLAASHSTGGGGARTYIKWGKKKARFH